MRGAGIVIRGKSTDRLNVSMRPVSVVREVSILETVTSETYGSGRLTLFASEAFD